MNINRLSCLIIFLILCSLSETQGSTKVSDQLRKNITSIHLIEDTSVAAMINDEKVLLLFNSGLELGLAIQEARITRLDLINEVLNNISKGENIQNYREIYGETFVQKLQKYFGEDSLLRNHFLNRYSYLQEYNEEQRIKTFNLYVNEYANMDGSTLKIRCDGLQTDDKCWNTYVKDKCRCDRNFTAAYIGCVVLTWWTGGIGTVVCIATATYGLTTCHDDALVDYNECKN